MRKPRQYRRHLTKEQVKHLREKYAELLQNKRGGCLGSKTREWLIGIRRDEEDLVERERQDRETKTWSRIKQTIHDSLLDMNLVCEIADEKTLEGIFFGVHDNRKSNPFLNLLVAILLPEDHSAGETTWRKAIREELLARMLDHYVSSGILTDGLRKRTMSDALEIVEMISEKDWKRKFETDRRIQAEGDTSLGVLMYGEQP